MATKGRSRLLLQYLASYSALVLVPLLAFTLFLFRYVSDLLVEEARANAEARLYVLQTSVDRELGRLNEVALKIGSSQQLRPFRLADAASRGFYAVQALDDFLLPGGVISEIFLRFHADDYVLSSDSTFHVDRIAAALGEGEDAEAVIDRMLDPAAEVGVWGPARLSLFGGPRRIYLCASFFVPSWTSGPYATVTMLVAVDDLFSPVVGLPEHAQTEYALANRDRTVVLSTDADLNPADLPAATERGLSVVDAAGRRRLVLSGLAPATGWLTYALVDEVEITRPAGRLRGLSALVIVAVVGVAAVLILALLRMNYAPVDRLVRTIAGGSEADGPVATIGEATARLRRIVEQDKRLRGDARRNRVGARDAAVAGLLSGTPLSAEDLTPLWVTGSSLPGPQARYSVLVVRPGSPSSDGGPRALAVIESAAAAAAGARAMFREAAGAAPIVGIISAEDPVMFAEALAGALATAGFHQVAVGLGSRHESLSGIGASLDSALRAVDRHFVMGDRRVYDAAAIAPPDWSRAAVEVDSSVFRRAVVGDESEELADHLASLVDRLRDARAPGYVARGVAFEICSVVSALYRELARGPGDGIESGACMSEMDSHATFEDFLASVLDLVSTMSRLQADRVGPQVAGLVDQVRRNIDRQFADPQLSMLLLAEEVGLSTSALSRYFKEQVGIGPNAYLAERRLRHAEKLLVETDLPLKELAQQVGYHNVSSFIRRFRQLTGRTPGEYRETRRWDAVHPPAGARPPR